MKPLWTKLEKQTQYRLTRYFKYNDIQNTKDTLPFSFLTKKIFLIQLNHDENQSAFDDVH
jgi:hypothetical protein